MNNENCEIEVKKPRTINKTLKGKKYYNSNKERTINTWSSYKELKVNALALGAEEGRGKLRKAAGSCKQTLIRRCPNGAIHIG